jgi:hypothetical protein
MILVVLVPGGGGAVGVQDDGPAPLVDDDLVVEEAGQGAVVDAGRAAVGPVPEVADLTGAGWLVAAAQPVFTYRVGIHSSTPCLASDEDA